MCSIKLFLQVAKKRGGTIKVRHSNIGLSYCLYDENENPVIYCSAAQWAKIIDRYPKLFYHNIFENTFFIKKQIKKK